MGRDTITLADFDREFRQAVARVVNAQGIPFSDDVLAEFTGARGDFLKQLVRDRVIYQLAQAAFKPDPAAIDRQVSEARADFEDDAAFAEALGQAGYTDEAALRAGLERQSVVNQYLENLQGRFRFSDTVVAGFYNLNRASFASGGEACVKHILVPTRAEADAVVTALGSGQDFATLAKAQSQDPGSAAQGGDLGCLAQGDTVAPFDEASFKGPLNQPQVVQTEYGWHVLIVSSRKPAGTLPLAEAAPLIRERLARDAAQKYLDAQVARVKTETFPAVVTVPTGDK